LVVHVEGDLFDEAAEPALERRSTANQEREETAGPGAAFLSDFRDLKVGDYVVHIDHGIARFGGLVTLDLGQLNRLPAAWRPRRARVHVALLCRRIKALRAG